MNKQPFKCSHCNKNTDVLCSHTQFSPFYDGKDYCTGCFKGQHDMLVASGQIEATPVYEIVPIEPTEVAS